jgi:hypothetical protein
MPNDPKPETAIAADTRPAAPCDPSAFDPVARQLRELEAELLWIDEYRLQFENKRNSDPAEAERMLFFLIP